MLSVKMSYQMICSAYEVCDDDVDDDTNSKHDFWHISQRDYHPLQTVIHERVTSEYETKTTIVPQL